MADVRWKDKPQLVALAGTELLAGTSIDGGAKVGGGTIAAGADTPISTGLILAAAAAAADDAIADAIAALAPAGVITVNGASGTPIILQALAIACSDETTALTTGANKVKFINPYSTAFNLQAVVASLSTAQASGSIFTVDINEAGTTILSTKLTIDNTETNSSTAATAAVISDASIAAYAEIGIDIDQIGDGTAKGLKVYLIGYPTPGAGS